MNCFLCTVAVEMLRGKPG